MINGYLKQVNKIQLGWYIPCLAVMNVHIGHTQYWHYEKSMDLCISK